MKKLPGLSEFQPQAPILRATSLRKQIASDPERARLGNRAKALLASAAAKPITDSRQEV
jgi:hypothetical protein